MFAADQERWSAQSSARTAPIERVIWHHQASVNDDATIGMMVSGSRQVSSTWTVDFEPPVGGALRSWARITAVVPEGRRPWTTSSALDDGALTIECANESGSPYWGISSASHEACARLAAYAYQAHRVPLQRATAANGWRGHMGHSEAPDTYATFCPGNMDIDYIIARAQQIVGGSLDGGALGPTPEDEMTPDQMQHLKDFIAAEVLAAKTSIMLEASFGRPAAMFYVDNPGDPGDRTTALVASGMEPVTLTNGADIGYYMGKGISGAPRPVSSLGELDSIGVLFHGFGGATGNIDTQRVLDAIKANPATGTGGATPAQVIDELRNRL